MKNILSIGYYSDFSRFFSILNKGVSKKLDINWVNLSIYPSGFIYDLIHHNHGIYLGAAVSNCSLYEINDIDLQWICEYHGNTVGIQKEAKKFLTYYNEYLLDNKIDLIILSGDSRMPVRALLFLAKKYNINVCFFEQGPLNTTILDVNGVNANCSFRENSFISNDDSLYLKAKESKPIKWKGYKKYRIFDIIYQQIVKNELLGTYKIAKTTNYPNYSNCVHHVDKKIILVVLQVPEDANMICHSPFFSDHYSIIVKLFNSMPSGYRLVIREHPLYKGKYEDSLYKFAFDNNIEINSEKKLNDALDEANLVIVNNSTVGLEAMIRGRKVLVLGDSYYDNEKFVYKYKGGDMQPYIIKALNDNSISNMVINRVNYLFNEEFIPGHFRDLNESRFSHIVQWIVNVIK
ncbi:TPA: hypothetical protein ACX6RW_003378 [Photobacterium damselae]